MVNLPRLVVAAPSTGQGKTTVATGLMAALTGQGLTVSGHKVGPDYIDPGYHALATGRPGRNLDPHLVGEELVAPLLLHGARGADLAVIEGVMGLFDGRLGTDGFASTAHVATLTRTPVVLVVDVTRMSRSAAAIVVGMQRFDPTITVAGVILNRARPGRNTDEIVRAMPVPVLGVVPHEESVEAPSRHLGLVPAAERIGTRSVIERLGEHIAKHVDLDAVRALAATAPEVEAEPWSPAAQVTPVDGAPVVAVAGGRAFTFRYPETDELLRAAGARVVEFDPLHDAALPPGTRALYLGGGFPEVHVGQLAANRSLLAQIRSAVQDGLPTVAECAGLLYLLRELEGTPMAGVLPAGAAMQGRLTLRYPRVIAASDNLLSRQGESIAGHEFHRTSLDAPLRGWQPAWEVDGELIGAATPTLHASYLHVHWAGAPVLAQRFAEAAVAASEVLPPVETQRDTETETEPGSGAQVRIGEVDTAPVDLLLHHGDREATPGLIDFAVNVHPESRPAWLEVALARGVTASARYPDPEPARLALAERHHRRPDEVLVTAGAAEAFELIARMKQWQRPVVVHPQFTEPHAALERAGHHVEVVHCKADDGYRLDPSAVPDDADLVMIGNPTNPTGVLHPAEAIAALRRPKRVVVVDEAFMDTVPGQTESLAGDRRRGLLVVRSLTKHWSMPGIRAGYVLGNARTIAALAARQIPWSVGSPAISAAVACTTDVAHAESEERARRIAQWRTEMAAALQGRGFEVADSATSFLLVRLGAGTRERLRDVGVAVRRADTFPGLDDATGWVRVAVRPPGTAALLYAALDQLGRRSSLSRPAGVGDLDELDQRGRRSSLSRPAGVDDLDKLDQPEDELDQREMGSA